MKPHLFRSHRYCWCDKDGVAQFNCVSSILFFY